ncbi:MAG: amidohydrolase family protein [Gemmataceae bacterium]
MNRRIFLAGTLAATATATLPSTLLGTPPMLPVIDTHQHLWDLTKVRLSWLTKGSLHDAPFTPTEYATATDGLNIVQAVYMEVDVVPEDKQAEADYLIDLCKSRKTPTRAAVLGGNLLAESFPKYVKQFQGSPFVKGIRQVLHADSTPPGHCLQPAFIKQVQQLGELGLRFDLCIRPAELPNYVKLVEACPGTQFVLDHCGNPNAKFTAEQTTAWKNGLTDLAARPNIVCKVSGFLANGYEKGKWTAESIAPVVNTVCETFGWDRVMFGGDWPVVLVTATYKEWLTALREVIRERPEAQQRKLLHDNAVKFYGLAE